ncbi:MAG: MFS transporter [Clostridia bacterium]
MNYKRTVFACYLGLVMQALVCNILAIIFVSLQHLYNLKYTHLGFLVLVNFFVQVCVDLFTAKPLEKYGFRIFTYIAPCMVVIGLILFIITPYIFSNVIVGFTIATVIFSSAAGMLEVVLSPMIENMPLKNKDRQMAMLHSFYGWGQLLVVVITTLFIFAFGEKNWQIAVAFWLILPVVVFLSFFKAPITELEKQNYTKETKPNIKTLYVFVAVLAIAFGGAAEVIMSQWSSTFMQNAVQVPKIVGDILAVATFAGSLALGRYMYGKFAKNINLSYLLIAGAFASFLCYIVVALVNVKWIAILACCLSGFAVSLLWPGTIVLASSRYAIISPMLFAVLAFGGDIGCSIGPYLVGKLADIFQNNAWVQNWAINNNLSVEQASLKFSLLIGSVFALGACACQIIICIMNKRKKQLEIEQ